MSKFRIIKKTKPVMEDDAANQNSASQASEDPQLTALNTQRTQLVTKAADLEKKYLDDKKNIVTQLAQIDAQIAKLGGKVDVSNESASPVNESVAYGKQKELGELIKDSFLNIEDKLSYWPSVKEIEDGFFDNIARGIIRYVNSHGYSIADEVDHSSDIKDALLAYFKNTKFNYSEREIEHIHQSLVDVLRKSDNSFGWLVKGK